MPFFQPKRSELENLQKMTRISHKCLLMVAASGNARSSAYDAKQCIVKVDFQLKFKISKRIAKRASAA